MPFTQHFTSLDFYSKAEVSYSFLESKLTQPLGRVVYQLPSYTQTLCVSKPVARKNSTDVSVGVQTGCTWY